MKNLHTYTIRVQNIILAMIGLLDVELMEATTEMIHGVGVHPPARISMI
jgi:hypothetical protein